jgi:hypothetical protein
MRRPAIIVQERKPLPVALAMVVARPPTRFPFIYSSTFSDLWIDSSSSDTSTGHDHGADRESHLGRGGQNAKGEGYRTVGVIHIESEIQTENAHLRLAPKVELRTRPDQTRPVRTASGILASISNCPCSADEDSHTAQGWAISSVPSPGSKNRFVAMGN